MGLSEELKLIDPSDLAISYRDLSHSMSRLLAGEPPLEFFTVTDRYSFVEVVRDAVYIGGIAILGSVDFARDVASGAYMAAATLGTYSSTHGTPRLENVDKDGLEVAFVTFSNRLAREGTSAIDSLVTDFPFADTLIDLAMVDGMKSGFTKSQTIRFSDGVLRATGSIVTYAQELD